ncbi:MAG: hypothetical protein KJO84_06210 [Acidimicrobiia bacterium]|nr:hypothetical protein [Acidimicrobiia bacterium]NNC75671.1 hypothetical protein [Acidimicrobiia bacterium]
MKLRVSLLLVASLIGAACTSNEPAAPRLAVIDDTGNISLVDAATEDRTRITTNAASSLSYFQPVWSPSEDLFVYSEATPDGSRLVLVDGNGDFKKRIETPVSSFFHQWNPQGDRIAFLGNGAAGLEFHVADVEAGTTTMLGTGAPFYFDWSPEGDRIIAQVGREELSIRDLDGAVETLDAIPGEMQAPQWTDHGRWYVSDGRLVLDDDGSTRTIAIADGFITFAVSGDRVAVQSTTTGQDGTSVAFQPAPVSLDPGLHVVDIESGETELVNRDPVLGFWWSPDGTRLAYLTLDDLDTVEGSWHVWDGTGLTTVFPAGRPSLQFFRDLAPFFDQYTRSMTVWSPDGESLVHPMVLSNLAGIWVLPLSTGEPTQVGDGVWATWNR